ncbi:MAG: c-type cytochrome [Rhizobacter sp.]|nr:c-type cytochrome [Rhizobacter sp.]
MLRSRLVLATLALSLAGAGHPACAGKPAPAPTPRHVQLYAQAHDVQALTALGRALFFDRTLSASGRLACASCHDPHHAYGPPPGQALRPGGLRAVPSLRYLQGVPPFSEHFFDAEGDDSLDAGPTGGHTWDGRAGSAHEQARLPLLSPSEMGNRSPQQVVRKIARAPYAEQFRRVFGPQVFDEPAAAFEQALLALEVFQQSPADFAPFSSRYDAVLRGQARLTAEESRGLALFNDPARGNCASCHRSEPGPDGALPLFTDFGHIALAVPRNRAIAANTDPRFFDLGLCGPLRTDLAGHMDYCGRFRTPSLRNVALRDRFFHNAAVRTLEEAVRFYAERDTAPARWYGSTAGRYNDLPRVYHRNVHTEPPFGGRPGDTPRLDAQDVRDIVAFLKTLTDADASTSPEGRRPRR